MVVAHSGLLVDHQRDTVRLLHLPRLLEHRVARSSHSVCIHKPVESDCNQPNLIGYIDGDTEIFCWHLWQEMKYFWHRSAVITWSAESTLSRNPWEVPTMFLSLQNLLTSLDKERVGMIQINGCDLCTCSCTPLGWTQGGTSGEGPGVPPSRTFSPPIMFDYPGSPLGPQGWQPARLVSCL